MEQEAYEGGEQRRSEPERLSSFREAMRFERNPMSDGDGSDNSNTITKVGHPEALAEYGRFQMDEVKYGVPIKVAENDCAVVAQENALTALGVETSTEEIRQIGENMRPPAYMRGEGSTPAGLGYAFESKGVGREVYTQEVDVMNSQEPVSHLRSKLEQDHAVLVGVDTPTLYGPESGPGGHALWVTGAEFSREGQLISVHVNDPGIRDGQNIEYDGKTFIDAWREKNYLTVSSHASFKF